MLSILPRPSSVRRFVQIFNRRVVPSCCALSTMTGTPWKLGTNIYPKVRRSEHVEVYQSASRGKVEVLNPYQWMEEDKEETAQELDEFLDAENALTEEYLALNPNLPRLEQAMHETNNYAKHYAPALYPDGRWYWFYNSGTEPQTAFFRSKTDKLPDSAADGEMFFDPLAFAEDGTASLNVFNFSKCGKYFAYGISFSGSDSLSVFVRRTDSPLTKDVDLNNDSGRFPEVIKNAKYTEIQFTPDGKGIFFQAFPEKSEGVEDSDEASRDAMIIYHRLGTEQSEDIIIHSDPKNRDSLYGLHITQDEKYMLLCTWPDCGKENMTWVAELDCDNISSDIKWNKVKDTADAEVDFVCNEGPLFYFRTSEGAPRNRVISVDLANNNEVREVIPESDGVLTRAESVNGNYFMLTYKRNVKDELYIYTHQGELVSQVAKDFVGTIGVTHMDYQSWFFVTLSGFTTPTTILKYDFSAPEEERTTVYQTTYLKGLDTEQFEARQVWYESKDGTSVPMFIVRHKDTPFDGTAAAVQYGYGGFGVNVDPFFSAGILTFLKIYGVVLAVPNIRGGGELGEDWHMSAILDKKYKSYEDFIAATEYLVKNKYAAAGKVALNGGSNGGLLVAACVNRAPEGTFGCAIPEVGVLDLLKFHKFTIGKSWASDYGNPDNPTDFDYILPNSPLHNIDKNKVYPPMLIMTADHDDRVVPAHSLKFAAELQYSRPDNPHPLLLRVDKKSGHGAGKSTQKRLKESAIKWSFAAQAMSLEWKDKGDP